jgi:3' terminal RNA ribose 2'-O-methyltransferase Hen1
VYLTITSTAADATDLGYLLHKHPDRVQQFPAARGVAHVFYPEASPERCSVALLLELDPIALVRGRRPGSDAFALSQYVNDRPYAASSMLAVALGKVFRTAMSGRCEARPELVDQPLPLEVDLFALPTGGDPSLVTDLFGPLGWSVDVTPLPLDATMPGWGVSQYVDVRLSGTVLLSQALSHLYVLLPVLDGAKHYWVSEDEVDKLLRAGTGWLAEHPKQDMIMRRYLAHQRELVATAVSRLAEVDDLPPGALDDAVDAEDAVAAGHAVAADHAVDSGVADDAGVGVATAGQSIPLAALRQRAVLDVLRAVGAARVVDLGCGEGALLRELIKDPGFTEILGVDVSPRALARAERRLDLERMPDRQRSRLRLMQSSVTYRDRRLAGYDAVVLMEVIEHLDPARLPALEASVFASARPRSVVITTPNAEHNARFERLEPTAMRHHDHRFEWSRAEFAAWATGVCDRSGYQVTFTPIGPDDPALGSPTQMAVFTSADADRGQGS